MVRPLHLISFGIAWAIGAIHLYGQQPQEVNAAISPESVLAKSDRYAAGGEVSTSNPAVHPDLAAYRFAYQMQDLHSAAAHLTHYAANHPDHLAYQDTLMDLYFRSQNLISCVLLAEKLLEREPRHAAALEHAALCHQLLGKPKSALSYFERWYALNGSAFALYQVAALQFELERNKECLETIHTLLQSDWKGEEINIWNEGNMEKVPLKAASWNLKGTLFNRQGKIAEAITAYQKALELAPKFTLAKTNLAKLNP